MKNALDYLSLLELNNNREWYHSHKEEHKQAASEFEDLVQTLIFEIGQFDDSVIFKSPKELIYRLMRDTRLSTDKTPYNPSFRAHISYYGKMQIPVGYYISVKPDNRSFLGGGLFTYMFRDATLMIRDHIAQHGYELQEIVDNSDFKKYFTLKGTALKNVPKGYDPFHPQAELLKNKNWYVEYPITDKQLLSEDFIPLAAEIFRVLKPLNDYLNKALKGFVMPRYQ